MLLEFKDRDDDKYEVDLTEDGIDIDFVDHDGFSQSIQVKDEDKVRLASALLTLQRADDLTIETLSLGERVRLGAALVDVPTTQSSADAVLERATALLASVSLYQENVKRRIDAEAALKEKAERGRQINALRTAVKMVAPALYDWQIEGLYKAGVRVPSADSNV